MLGQLDGKVAIVTGGSQGIGLAIARTFLREGSAVVTCARSSFDSCPAAEDADQASRAMHVATDVRDDVQLDHLIQTTVDRFGRIDILVNNAGGQPPADIAEASPRFIRAIIDLNLVAPTVLAIKVYQVMKEQESGGSIINISSQASMVGDGGRFLAPYGAAKAGLNHMTRSLGIAWGRKVRVNCVSPGYVDTDVMAELLLPNDGDADALQSRLPVGRMGTVDDIAQACLYLSTDRASFINGATLWVDGGGLQPVDTYSDQT